jgi:hypothetical protein
MTNKYKDIKDVVAQAFKYIPDITPGRAIDSQKNIIDEQGEKIVDQSVEVKQQTKEVKDIIDGKGSKRILRKPKQE